MTSAGNNFFLLVRPEGPFDLFGNLKLFPASIFGWVVVGILGFSLPKCQQKLALHPERFLCIQTYFFQYMCAYKHNLENALIFVPYILWKIQGKKKFSDTKLILMAQMDTWEEGQLISLVKDSSPSSKTSKILTTRMDMALPTALGGKSNLAVNASTTPLLLVISAPQSTRSLIGKSMIFTAYATSAQRPAVLYLTSCGKNTQRLRSLSRRILMSTIGTQTVIICTEEVEVNS